MTLPRDDRANAPIAAGPVALGRHWLVECHELAAHVADDVAALKAACVGAARAAGATVVGAHFHTFEPHGVSGVVLLAESHLTLHTWPEFGYAAIDLFSCSDAIRVEPAVESLKGTLGTHAIRVSAALTRGLVERVVREGPEPQLSWRARHAERRFASLGLSVDVEGCPERLLGPELLPALQRFLATTLGLSDVPRPTIAETGEGEWSVFAPFEGGHAALALRPRLASVHLDLVTRRFVEPAPFAMQVRELVQGSRHVLTGTFR